MKEKNIGIFIIIIIISVKTMKYIGIFIIRREYEKHEGLSDKFILTCKGHECYESGDNCNSTVNVSHFIC